MPQRILHVVNSMDPVLGGVSKAVRTIVTSLRERGIDNEVVCLDDANPAFISNDTFKIHALGFSSNPWGYNPKLLPWLKDNLRHYDSIIVHGLWLYCSFAVYLAINAVKSQDRPKSFVMPHGMLDPYFQKAEGRRLKALRNWLYWKLVEKRVVNGTDGILFTCEQERLLAKQPFQPYTPKSEYIVGLGVEAPPSYQKIMDVAFYNNCKISEGQPYLLFLSRIHEKKGVDLLIKAYEAMLSDSAIELPALVIAGPGLDTSYGKHIYKMVFENDQLKHRVFFPGMLSGDAKWGAFYNCEAFVLPSHQENFGIAVVEALACGKPVLISDQVNIWNEINEARAGFVESDTVDGTKEVLKIWMSLSLNERVQLGQQALNCYKTYYSIESMVKRFQQYL
jgi:glycosyltransferase involved in cell wall biosynthesis